MRFAKESWPFVLPPLLVAAVTSWLGLPFWALTSAVLAVLMLLFFRVPTRRIDGASDEVVSPANGRVLQIETVEDEEIGEGRFHRIVTFLSVFDVHVQRAPIAGDVVTSRFRDGRKVPAFDRRAGVLNQQQLTVLRRPNGDLVGVRQIAGLLARRVVSYLQVGDRLRQGDLIGLIKFGSRVDLLVPVSYDLRVSPGQRLREGETPVASLRDDP